MGSSNITLNTCPPIYIYITESHITSIITICTHRLRSSLKGSVTLFPFYRMISHICPHQRKEMFNLTTHSRYFIYGYMTSEIWKRTIQIVREETRCRHYMGCSFRLAARVIVYASSHRQENTYHGLCYTSRGALAGTRSLERHFKLNKTSRDIR